MILRNRARCRLCGDVVESSHRHDFKWCSCHSVAVDGGRAYIRRVGRLEDTEELSEFDAGD
ncbi:MAG: DUF7695 domain-containing protein [Egibacteraceae bacterium]